MRISDWSSDVCSSDLLLDQRLDLLVLFDSLVDELRCTGTLAHGRIEFVVFEFGMALQIVADLGEQAFARLFRAIGGGLDLADEFLRLAMILLEQVVDDHGIPPCQVDGDRKSTRLN